MLRRKRSRHIFASDANGKGQGPRMLTCKEGVVVVGHAAQVVYEWSSSCSGGQTYPPSGPSGTAYLGVCSRPLLEQLFQLHFI